MNKKIVLIILISLLLSLTSGCIETGKGVSVDTIYGIEYNGLIWKTYSVWLTNDHPTKEYSAIYTVNPNDKETINKLKEAYNSGKKVKILYRNELFIFPPWEYTGNAIAIIYDIEEI